MLRLSLALLLALAACGSREPEPVGLRAAGKMIYSSTAAEPARMEGRWTQVATFVPEGQAPCGGGQVTIEGGRVAWDLCLPQGRSRGEGAFQPDKAGRFAVAGMADWWVLWLDGDARTALVGTPSGEFGFVLNRGGDIPADRVRAVRDVAAFNGYREGDLALF